MMLRGQVSGIILGTVFLFIGLAACGIAVVRGGSRIRLLVWFGNFQCDVWRPHTGADARSI